MKRNLLVIALIATALIFSYCSSSRKTASKTPPKEVYTGHVETLIMANCAPCHIPAKGGNKKPLDTYDNAKAQIDEIIKRIELHPGEKGFMPSKKPRLSDSTIAVFKKWKEDGLLN
jgi:mono/diheme cytochrome c family protein